MWGLEGATSGKKEGRGFGARAPALRSRRENCGGQMKATKHHRLICFSGKAKSVDNKRDPIPINMNQHGEHTMFRTMIPWLRVRMGLWCNKICINNIKWRFKTISFCDPRPFKASWCKLITSSRISVPLWFFLTQIGSEIYFGLCHMSFPPYFYFFITHPCMILLGKVSPDSIKFHYGNGGLGNREDHRGCLCPMLLLLLQYSQKHTFMQGGVMWSGLGGWMHARDLAWSSFIPKLLHFWFVRTNFAIVCVSILTSVENDFFPPKCIYQVTFLERRQVVILHPKLIFLIENSSIGGYFNFLLHFDVHEQEVWVFF